jgi:hypothetical protein
MAEPPPGVERVELEAAADALTSYYLAGRRTDDDLLREVLTAADEGEAIAQRQLDYLQENRIPRRRDTGQHEKKTRAAGDRHLDAWRRWLDAQQPGQD